MQIFEISGLVGKAHTYSDQAHASVMLLIRGKPFSAGVLNADHINDGVWWIARCLVRPEFQGKGLGTFMMNKLKRLSQDIGGFKHFEVEPGGYGSDPIRQSRFYVTNGFVLVSEGLYCWPAPTEE